MGCLRSSEYAPAHVTEVPALQERSAIIAALKAHAALQTAVQRFLDLRAEQGGADASHATVLTKVILPCLRLS